MPHPFLLIAAPIVGLGIVYFWRRQTRRLRRRFIDDFSFPPALTRKLRETYPHLSAAQAERTLDALRDYFVISLWARKRLVSMPSQAVDVVWHQFILDTRAYQRFCQQAFGRFLHHTPAESMRTPTDAQQGIKRAWALACRLEDINARKPKQMPLLFGLDALLDIPDGFRYSLNCQDDPATSANANGDTFCASHISCSSGNSGCSSSGCSGGSDGGSGCSGGGCGGGGD